jgi:hypothetical protein
MKKGLIVVAAAATLCFTNIALAASDQFSDVPAKHWAYDAVSKLAQAGIVSGYDGSFQGERTLTRYQMAEIVANAMTKTDKANAENKALIDKLSAEFSDELKALGKRVDTVEKKQGPLTIDGFAQYRYEYTKNPRMIAEDAGLAAPGAAGRADDKSASRTLLWLNIANQFDGDTYFHGILGVETLGGRTNVTSLQAWEANFNKKIGANAEVGLGRFFPSLGFGTISGAPYMDGGKLSFGKAVKVNFYSARLGDRSEVTTSNPSGIFPHRTYNLGDVKFSLDQDTDMAVSFVQDKHKEMYNSAAIGLKYKGISDVVLDGEWGRNTADFAKLANGGSAPEAYFIRAKYKGANPFVVGSTGYSVQYKYAEPGFDALAFASPFAWNAPLNYTTVALGGIADNLKGFEVGFETTVAKRTIFNMRYNKLDRVKYSAQSMANNATNDDQSFFTAQVTYIF